MKTKAIPILVMLLPATFATDHGCVKARGNDGIAFCGYSKPANSPRQSLLLQRRHAGALSEKLDRLKAAGPAEVLKAWVSPTTGRESAISNKRPARLNADNLPIRVKGDPIQYQINRNNSGWVMESTDNKGVIKEPDKPVIIVPHRSAKVNLLNRIPVRSAYKWCRSNNIQLLTVSPITITVGPGESVYVELIANQ